MRIAYLSTFYPFRGGIAQFNASLYREFEQTHQVKAFTFIRQYPDVLFPGKTQYVKNNEQAQAIPSEAVLDSINPFSYFSAARKIKAFQPDLLIMKYWMTFFGPSLGTVAKLMPKHTKVITILDNVIPHESRFFDEMFSKYFLKQNHGFVAMSDSVKHDLRTLAPNARCLRKDHPLYNHFGEKPNAAEAKLSLGLDADKKTLLFFGFIRDYKGLDVLIKAFDMLDNSYQLIIAGETYGSFDKYQTLINSITKRNQVFVFNNYIADDQVPRFFAAADVCVLPYRTATQSGITSIAYHFDIPVIATDVGGLKESIKHLQTGLIVTECEPDTVAYSIREFFDKKLSAKLVAGIKSLKETLSWKSFANDIVEFANGL